MMAFGSASIDTSADSFRTVFHAPVRIGAGNRCRMLVHALLTAALLLAVFAVGRVLHDAATVTDFASKNLAPSVAHPFGTDQMGRDMLARTLAGLSTSLVVGASAALASTAIALALAVVSVLGGRTADTIVQWLIDLTMGIPHIILLILISYALGRGAVGVTVGVALTHWPSLTRLLRVELLQLMREPYMEQSRALGVKPLALVCAHVLPALVPQLVVGCVLTFPHAILHEASITFLGFGLSPDEPAIGVILSEAMGYLTAGAWWLTVLPGAALVVCVLLFDHLGTLLRRMLGARTVQE